MTTLIYSPGVSIVIETAALGMVNVTDDVTEGSLSLRENGSHTANFSLSNPFRKYDGVFAPNDRVIIQLKRIKWMQVFAGYLDTVPYFTTYPGQVRLSAQCSLKVLKNFPWDSKSGAAFDLIHGQRNRDASDGGVSEIVVKLLRDVAKWPEERIHIGMIPTNWYSKFETIRTSVEKAAIISDSYLGLNATIAGSTTGTVLGTSDMELITIRDQDIETVLATIRSVESGGNYAAVNKGKNTTNWATGAYQFLNSTWAGYAGFTAAYLAPPEVQDEKAREKVKATIAAHGRSAVNIPYSWYWPAVFRDPTWLDRIPAESQGNKLTLREYGIKWVTKYVKNFKDANGGVDPPRNASASAGFTTPVAGVGKYPIPAGTNLLDNNKVGWGGFENGRIPTSAMEHSAETGYGHPLAVKSWKELTAEAFAAGFDVKGLMYRSYGGQEALTTGMGVSVPGTSNHGWGLAVDVTLLSTGSESISTRFKRPEYLWLQANAARFGWGTPTWAQEGNTKPEPWHWEFFAIYSFLNADAGITGLAPTGDPQASLFGALKYWEGDASEISAEIFMGYRALINDSPIMEEIQNLISATGRSYCSAPNGDFISWFPDYWGEYGIAGSLDIETIELKNFSVNWSDSGMITHQYVIGATKPSFGALPGGIIDAIQNYNTRGIVTVDMPGILEAVLNVGETDFPWLKNPKLLLERYGARVNKVSMDTITTPEAEFWFAVKEFTKAWASQFTVSDIPMTFMPEVFPGMLLRIPEFGVQFYVTGVNHSWSLSDGGEFSTSVSAIAPSATDGTGFFLFPRAGAQASTSPAKGERRQ